MGPRLFGRTVSLLFPLGDEETVQVVDVCPSGWVLEGGPGLAGRHGAAYALVNVAGRLDAYACSLERSDGRRIELKVTAGPVHIATGRSSRAYVSGLTMSPLQGRRLVITEASSGGLGFLSVGLPPYEALADFSVRSGNRSVRLTGSVVHLTEVLPGLYRGGVSLRLRDAQSQAEWTKLLSDGTSRAA